MPKRVDLNQPAIVAGLRKAGALVQPIHEVGRGCPDLLVGKGGTLFALEIKLPGEERNLTEAEKKWHCAWGGYPVYVVCTLEDALRAIGAID